MPFHAPIGTSDFRSLRREGLTYVDKSGLVTELLEERARVVLLPRPRRFGKTLNLSMLRYFFGRPVKEGEDHADLFEGLEVWGSPAAREHFQQYPVIFISFKDLKDTSWEEGRVNLEVLLQQMVGEHRAVLDHPAVDPERAAWLRDVLTRKTHVQNFYRAIRELSMALYQATGTEVVLLIDEYDTPVHVAWLHGYFDQAVAFFRGLLGSALKDNPSLFKGVLTGILRIARENLFSDLNNIAVHSVLSRAYSTRFGFTEAEVAALAAEANCLDHLPGIQSWYNGYDFAGTVIYNPWSVLSYLAHPEDGYIAYWVNTSGSELISRLLTGGSPDLSAELEVLLGEGLLEKNIQENLALRDVDREGDAVWTLLLFSGYLSGRRVSWEGQHRVLLRVPNREIASIFDSVFRSWMAHGTGGSSSVRYLLDDLLQGRQASFQGRLQELVLRSLSFHDVEKRQPERVYHAFVLGLLVSLQDTYRVQSNPEAGYGRADVMVIPRLPGRPGVVLEFKRVDEEERWEDALSSAMAQLREKDYAATLRAAGATPIREVGVVFDGKRVRVAWASA